MPTFTIRTSNAALRAEATFSHSERPDDALAAGVSGAAAMLADEVARGAPAAAVDVSVYDEGEQRVRRVAVTLAVAPLLVD